MRARPICIQVEFVSAEGWRLSYGEEGWKVENVRQLGHAHQAKARELAERGADAAERTPPELLGDDELLGRAQYAAKKLGLRVTHKRTKLVEPGALVRRQPPSPPAAPDDDRRR